jgi:hypothetical protein
MRFSTPLTLGYVFFHPLVPVRNKEGVFPTLGLGSALSRVRPLPSYPKRSEITRAYKLYNNINLGGPPVNPM